LDPTVEPPTVIHTSTIGQDISIPVLEEITHTMNALIEKYEMLDKDSRNELLKYAITSCNEILQSHLLMLCQSKTGTSLAKLTKGLIKLADSYKVLELKFDEQASK
jgi:acetolactate synthase small subunit